MDSETADRIALIQQISYPLYESRGWMKLVGVINIIIGVINALTIIGIIIAWLPIWQGILLFPSATAIEQAHETANEYELHRSLSKIKTYFIIMGVLTLLGIIFFIIAFAFGLMGTFFLPFTRFR